MPLATCVSHGTTGTCDIGLPCCPHGRSGTNAEGSPLAEAEGSDLHLVGHTGPCNCPHGGTFESVQGSQIFEVEGQPVTLVGHTTVCVSCGMSGAHSSGTELVEVEV
jgi:uncharacterized Zn-binding protein involved in type VI secretion